MTDGGLVHDPAVPPEAPAAFADIVGLLAEVTGEDAAWTSQVHARSRLDGDLLLDSIELAALDERLRRRYGDRVDLPAFFAGLDLDQLIGLTVADLARHVAAAGSAGGSTAASAARAST